MHSQKTICLALSPVEWKRAAAPRKESTSNVAAFSSFVYAHSKLDWTHSKMPSFLSQIDGSFKSYGGENGHPPQPNPRRVGSSPTSQTDPALSCQRGRSTYTELLLPRRILVHARACSHLLSDSREWPDKPCQSQDRCNKYPTQLHYTAACAPQLAEAHVGESKHAGNIHSFESPCLRGESQRTQKGSLCF